MKPIEGPKGAVLHPTHGGAVTLQYQGHAMALFEDDILSFADHIRAERGETKFGEPFEAAPGVTGWQAQPDPYFASLINPKQRLVTDPDREDREKREFIRRAAIAMYTADEYDDHVTAVRRAKQLWDELQREGL